jgi:hypothetical protein
MTEEERRESAMEALRALAREAKPRKELAWREIQGGVRPEWIALKYGLPLDDMLRAQEIHLEREQKRMDQRK